MVAMHFGGRPVVGFADGTLSGPSKPMSRVSGFLLGSVLTAAGGIAGAMVISRNPEDFVYNNLPVFGLAALGGGVAGAIATPGSSSS